MKKKIYVLVTFTTYNYTFTSSVHKNLEEAREAQMKWLEDICKSYGIPVPTKESLMEGNNEDFLYNEDSEYLCFYGVCDDSYSTIEIQEIEIAPDNEQDKLQEYADSIVIEGEDGELKHYHGTFNDGYAILTDDETGDTATLFYPLLGDLTTEQVRAIEEYTGRRISEYYQIAVKYGKIEKQERT